MPRPRTLGLLALAGLVALAAALAVHARRPVPWRPDGPVARGAVPAYLNFPHATPEGPWRTLPAFPHLRFNFAVRLMYEPRTHHYFVIEREGRIWTFPDDPNTTEKTLVLDLSSHTQGYFDCGLLGLAFHPDFGLAGRPGARDFFVWYNHTEHPKTPEETRPQPGTPRGQRISRFHIPSGNRLSRFRMRLAGLEADPASEKILIDQANETVFHEGGAMFFHPGDGDLYLTLGDDDLKDTTQHLDQDLFSGVVRLDVDCRRGSHRIRRQPRRGTTAGYCIPDDNPFVDPAGARLEEFWAVGLRSPHTMTFDAASGAVYIGDVGENSREEIDRLARGANFEWPFREGRLEAAPVPQPVLGTPTPPLYEYVHGLHACVIAGDVYHGAYPALRDKLLFGDNVSNHLFALDVAHGEARAVELARLPGETGYGAGLSSFATGAHGEIFLVRVGDQPLFELVPSDEAPPVIPARLSQTGAFSDVRRLVPRPGLVAYDVDLPQWANGARSRHYLALPEGATIVFGKNREWVLPRGAVAIQHLEDDGGPIETRFLVAERGDEAYALSYRWRKDGSDADLVTKEEASDAPWTFPSHESCMRCHNRLSGFTLGLNTRQINGHGRLRAWSEAGVFEHRLDEAVLANAPHLVRPDDASAAPLDRVRSYLDVNCAHCHRSGGVRGLFDARYTTAFAEQELVDGDLYDSLGMQDARVVAPGDPGRSILFLRLHATGPIGMPPVGKDTVDEQAVALFSDWISALPPASPAPKTP